MLSPRELLISNFDYFGRTFDSDRNSILKIMYIHAGQKYAEESDDYHYNLFESQLNLTTKLRFFSTVCFWSLITYFFLYVLCMCALALMMVKETLVI